MAPALDTTAAAAAAATEEEPGASSPDMACAVVHRDKFLLHHVQLLEAVRVLGVCDVPDVLENLGCVDGLAAIRRHVCGYCLQQTDQQTVGGSSSGGALERLPW